MESAVRIRVIFDDRRLLRKVQRKDGLRFCWCLLSPKIATISDLASYLAARFSLRCTSPKSILLSMDGFVLPSFESSSILKDKDIISVRRKCGLQNWVARTHGDALHNQESEIVEKEPISCGGRLLAIKEFPEGLERRRGNDDSPEDGLSEETHTGVEMNSRKHRRDSSKCLDLRRRKKLKASRSEEPIGTRERGDNVHSNQGERHSKKGGSKGKTTCQAGMSKDIAGSASKEERHDQVEEDHEQTGCETLGADGSLKKLPSRSARRKKAKRKWRRELANSEKLESELLENDLGVTSPEYQAKDQENNENLINQNAESQNLDHSMDVDEEVIPIVVRPGHIRFEPADGGMSKRQTDGTRERIHYNGITDKRKGQKWGREKAFRNKIGNDSCTEGFNEKLSAEEVKLVEADVDFEMSRPLTSQLKEGDVVAYRLVELSQSRTPELSPFRVGKVSSYDPISMKVVLLPVPNFPIFPGKKELEEDHSWQESTSLYREDGSLEIEYQLLMDIRLFESNEKQAILNTNHCDTTVKRAVTANLVANLASNNSNGTLDCATERRENPPEAAAGVPPGPALNHQASRVAEFKSSNREMDSDKSQVNGWAEIAKVLNEKKALLQEKDGADTGMKSKSSSTGPWCYRAIRRSALGPTIALLRESNDL